MSVQISGRDWLEEFSKALIRRHNAMMDPVDPALLNEANTSWEQLHDQMDAHGVRIYPVTTGELPPAPHEPIEMKVQFTGPAA